MSATHTNRLIHESSPYLLQHAHNPVDWYAWGPEAFEAARRADRPIFLSVGYSTCYWCHVMERECFENETIAQLMNELFICIKVDREERPDVDQLYMTAVQVMTQQGGWPMSVFLFPDLRPFYGGTYFPPRDAHGRPGFPTLMRAIDDAFRNRRDDVSNSANEVVQILQQVAEPRPNSAAILMDESWVADLVERSFSDYDATHGGFGGAPKFPRETLLQLGLAFVRHHPEAPSDHIGDALRHTLHAMADGGIRDQLGGGFHRYSTDAQWLVPHFEIMLYDNAMLASCYAEAAVVLNEPRFGAVADRICAFVLREMTSPDGVFFTAIDAEVDAHEGATYLWTRQQVIDALTTSTNGNEPAFTSSDAKQFCRAYGLDHGPNFADPHHDHGVAKTNVLFLARGATSEDEPAMIRMRDHLYHIRGQRKQPLLDDKIITQWNALMIIGLVRTAQTLQRESYLVAAATAMTRLLEMHERSDGRLTRVSRDGRGEIDGFIEDDAAVCLALLALADATGDAKWKHASEERFRQMRLRFGNAEGGFFSTEADVPDQIVRQMIGQDSPLPSGNGMAAMAALQGNDAVTARQTLSVFAGQLEPQAESMSTLLQAAMDDVRLHGPLPIPPRSSKRPQVVTPADQARQAVRVAAEWVSSTQIEVKLDIADGFHLNGPRVEPPLVATELRVHTGGNIVNQFYPPTNKQLDGLAIYTRGVLLAVTFAQPPKMPVKMTLIYQPCSASACLPSVTHQIELLPA